AMRPKMMVSSATFPWCSVSAAAIASCATRFILTPFRDRVREDAPPSYRSPARLTGSAREPLGAGQFREAHRTAGMQFLGRDPDLGAEAELAAVGEAGRGVRHDDG